MYLFPEKKKGLNLPLCDSADLSGVYVMSRNESGLIEVALMSVDDDRRL